jgi:hypothetical protein
MWIIAAGLVLTSLLILYYLIHDSSSIIIDKKNHRIIIPDKSPPTIIKFTELIKVDLLLSGARAIISDVKVKQEFIKKATSVCLKITIKDDDNPVYIHFVNREFRKNGFELKNAGKRAKAFYNKLSRIIDSAGNVQNKSISIDNSAAFQLKNLHEFKSNIARQSAS